MLKKALIGTAAAALLGGLALGFGGMRSYVSTAGRQVREAVKGVVPLKFEVERARTLLHGIDPEINKYKQVIAGEEVDIERLEAELNRTEDKLAQKDGELKVLADSLDSGKSQLQFAGSRRVYTPDEVRADIKSRLTACKTLRDTVEKRRELLSVKQKALNAANDKLRSMIAARKNLELQIENLDAKLRSVEARETASEISIDDSELSQTRQLIEDIEKHVRVREKVLEGQGSFSGGEIPVNVHEEASDDTLGADVKEYLQRTQPAAQTVEKGPEA